MKARMTEFSDRASLLSDYENRASDLANSRPYARSLETHALAEIRDALDPSQDDIAPTPGEQWNALQLLERPAVLPAVSCSYSSWRSELSGRTADCRQHPPPHFVSSKRRSRTKCSQPPCARQSLAWPTLISCERPTAPPRGPTLVRRTLLAATPARAIRANRMCLPASYRAEPTTDQD